MTKYFMAIFVLSIGLCAETLDQLKVRFLQKQVAGSEIMPIDGNYSGKFSQTPFIQDDALALNGDNYLTFSKITHKVLPTKNFSVEAVLILKKGARYGSILSYMQDNGSYEKGWLLGYNEEKFYFGLSTDSKLQYVYSAAFEKDKAYHIAATYDGKKARLYVNSKLAGTLDMPGEIAYPDEAYFCMGSYKDKDENFPMTGSLFKANFYSSVLTEKDLQRNSRGLTGLISLPLTFKQVPIIRYVDQQTAELTFQTHGPVNCKLAIDGGAKITKSSSDKNGFQKYRITQFKSKRNYTLSLSAFKGKQKLTTAPFKLETAVNYAPQKVAKNNSSAIAEDLLKKSHISNGLCALIGAQSVLIAEKLAVESDLNISILSRSAAEVQKFRMALYNKKLYGSRINVYLWEQGKSLAFARNLFNLVYAGIALGSKDYQELYELTKPGGMFFAKGKKAVVKKELKGQASWTSQYGNGGNTAYVGEELNNMSSTDKLRLQWSGRPGGDFGIDRNPRMPAPLAANGRLFHQGMNRMIAMDAHNGAILWNLEIPHLRRVNIPRDASNWTTDGKTLYTAVLDQLLCIDVKDGSVDKVLYIPKDIRQREGEWGFIGSEADRIYGSSVRKGTLYKDFWGKKKWYDKANSESTAKVCSESFFCYSKHGKGLWKYEKGLIINTTICYFNNRIYFIETRTKDLLEMHHSRLSEKSLWQNQFMVCLDGKSGKVIWEKPVDTADGDVVFYMQVNKNGILVTASNSKSKKYHLHGFSLMGRKNWDIANNWPATHHSGHMQHPVIIDDTIYLEPYAYSLKSGKQLFKGIGRREGCHTYVGIKKGLVFRGTSRQVSMWSMETKKTTTWKRLRPSCWLSMIPATGMLLVPEGGAGCSCGGWMETSLGFSPWEAK
ncbi:MAG: hypothetical protein MK132_22010 [Lentisphaerales bacterium]|nr:hypothetical protein [Lentisphaerales bacterium]